MRARYEVFLAGRVLKITEVILVPRFGATATEPAPDNPYADHVDSMHRWVIDERDVGEDVARAVFRDAGYDLDDRGRVTGGPNPGTAP